jgi:parvulin-like peptidyl-prolyl isomerase
LSAGGTNAFELGDRSLLDSEFHEVDPQAVAAQFGKEFASAVFVQPAGAWRGPVESAYGLHLVRVLELKPGREHEFAEVKPQILERWREQRQREETERYFVGLLRKYEVVSDDSVKRLVGPLASGKETAK